MKKRDFIEYLLILLLIGGSVAALLKAAIFLFEGE
jgi:hypothetical protein